VLPAGAAATYLPPIWEAGRQNGEQFALPWYLTARITMANQALLERAGVAAPPRRWDQLPAYAEAVHRRTGRYALFMTVVPDDSAELLETLVQQGVQLLDGDRRAAFDSEAGRQAFAFWSALYRRGLLPREVVSQGYRRAIGASGDANVAVMNLVVPRQSAMATEAVSFALHLTDATNQLAFAEQARVLPSAVAALEQLQRQLGTPQLGTPQPGAPQPGDPADRLVQRARLLSAQALEASRVLVPAIPGIKRLQAIVYTQLQRAMLGELSSDRALAEAALQWNRYAEARWP
jgi:putative chitobiose transport system substrate-binding protein